MKEASDDAAKATDKKTAEDNEEVLKAALDQSRKQADSVNKALTSLGQAQTTLGHVQSNLDSTRFKHSD
jgi:flagellin-like hook-associated protein FlgL